MGNTGLGAIVASGSALGYLQVPDLRKQLRLRGESVRCQYKYRSWRK